MTDRVPELTLRLMRASAWLVAGFALLASCVDQDKEISRYRVVLDTQPAIDLPADDAELTLVHALRVANHHNEQLNIQGEDFLQAMIEKDRAFSGFLPRITLSPSYSMFDQPSTPSQGNLLTNALRSSANSLVSQASRNAVLSALGQNTTPTAIAGAVATPTGTLGGTGGLTPGSVGTITTGGFSTNGTSGTMNGTGVGTLLGGGGTGATGRTGIGGTGGNLYSSNGTLHQTSVPLSATINLFNGFRDVANVRRADAVIDQRRQLLLNFQEVLLMETAQTYYQVLRSERLAEVLRNSLRVQEERVRDIRARQAAGLARPLDVAQTEAQASATRVSLIQAESDVRNGRTVLAFQIGAAAIQGRLSDAFEVPLPVAGVEYYEREAQASRHDLVAAAAVVRAAKSNVDIAIGQYYPSVTFNVNTFLYQENFQDASRWSTIFQANLPIFSAGLIEADVRAAWSDLRTALLSESLLKRQMQQEVRVAYENLRRSQERLRELRTQAAAAGEAFRQADQTYNVGLATNLERLTAQDQVLTAELQLASEEYNYKVFYLDLLQTIGLLTERVIQGVPPPASQPEVEISPLPASQPAAATAPADL